MSIETILANACVVTADDCFRGSVHVRDGRIHAVDHGGNVPPGGEDLEGDYLLPGLIELHTDNVEKQMVPRPGVMWPSSLSALLAHDAQVIAAGITTVLDAIAVGEYSDGSRRREILPKVVEAVREGRRAGLFRAEHLLHMRCEIADRSVLDMFEPVSDDPLICLVSVMDHTPGQRQWHDVEKYRDFYRDKGWTDSQFQVEVAKRREWQAAYAESSRRAILDIARRRGITLASHDDTTVEHVEEAVASGIRISEFPTTMAAARHAKASGMTTIAGAPNIVRGGSHSGNVSAAELAAEGMLDALSSDYVPNSLLHAAFVLTETVGMSLPAAIATVSANPARMVGLDDRGEISVGRRADLIRVRLHEGTPVVRRVWGGGCVVV
jgi:alpha-D-ribose 1-methylphosphonate 5-triphosphate diphosphatase